MARSCAGLAFIEDSLIGRGRESRAESRESKVEKSMVIIIEWSNVPGNGIQERELSAQKHQPDHSTSALDGLQLDRAGMEMGMGIDSSKPFQKMSRHLRCPGW